MSARRVLPYGLWPSPVTARMVGQGYVFMDVQWDSDGETLVWMENRSDRGVLVTRKLDGAPRDLIGDENVRARVGYGDGDFTVAQGKVFFVEMDGRIYRRDLAQGISQPIIPAFGRTASPKLSPDGRWLLFIYSDEKTDLLGLVDADGKEWPHQIARGADFYMQPCWHPDGRRIAWVEWDHPNMPWDETRIKLAYLEGAPPRLNQEQVIAFKKDLPSVEPQFSPDGRWLSYITSNGEWEDLVLHNLESGEKRTLIRGDQFLLTYPAWSQGRHAYGWAPDSQSLFNLRNFGGHATLWRVDIETGQCRPIDISPYTFFHQLSVSAGGSVAFLASSPEIPMRVVRWDGKKLTTVAYSTSEAVGPEFQPTHLQVSWLASDGTRVYAHYYAPKHPEYEGVGLPPALVSAHGGPTGGISTANNPLCTYFTTRGYAWLGIDYRGSTGYGLTYQRSMRQRWGEVDTEDVAGAAQALVDQGLADGKRLAIVGGSAGGYVVLNALIHHPGLFKAGIDLFGVSNLFNLALDTHKFESRYLDSMVGALPEAAERYRAFSPIYHAERIRDPLAIFQGAIDPVVLPNQSEDILAILQRNNVPHLYLKYEGEGHGFRKTETYVDFLEQTERFLRQYVLFA